MFSKSLIQFSVDGRGCVPSLFLTWVQTVVEVMKTMETSFKRSHACNATLSALNLHLHRRLLDTHSKSGSVSCHHCSFSWVLVCPPRVCFLVPCKFWWLYSEVNRDPVQEGLCHTQVCCTQSPCPCHNPLLTPHPGTNKKPQQGSRMGKSCLESHPIPARNAQRAQTNLVHTRTQRPHRD